jgi:hypothetical protein
MTQIERRIAGLEAAVERIAPKPSEPLPAECQWLRWATCDELTALEQIYWREENDDLRPGDEEQALAIMYSAQARMMAGEPPDKGPYAVELENNYGR